MDSTAYILISFYWRLDSDCHVVEWLVYGHFMPHNNVLIGLFYERESAIEKALEFGIPIMEGTGEGIQRIVEKLSK